MLDYQYFKIIFTVLLIWIGYQFQGLMADSIAYLLILTLGIVHGANDLLILRKFEKSSSNFIKSVIGYNGLIGLCILSFFIHPFISLLLFILISGYHFGEQHFENSIKASKWIEYSFYLFYGLIIFGMIFSQNMEEVQKIVFGLTDQTFPENSILIVTLISSGLLLILLIYGLNKKNVFTFNIVKEILNLALLFIAFRYTNLIFGFGLYFIFWHSIPSIMDQTNYLSGTTNKQSLLFYLKKAAPFWTMSIAGLLTLYFVMDESLFSSAIFLILFAVTAPHVWVMFRMKKN